MGEGATGRCGDRGGSAAIGYALSARRSIGDQKPVESRVSGPAVCGVSSVIMMENYQGIGRQRCLQEMPTRRAHGQGGILAT